MRENFQRRRGQLGSLRDPCIDFSQEFSHRKVKGTTKLARFGVPMEKC